METSKQGCLSAPAPSKQLVQPTSSSVTVWGEDRMHSMQPPMPTVYLNTLGLPMYPQLQPLPSQDSVTIHLSVPQLHESRGSVDPKQSLPTLTLSIVNGMPMLQQGQRLAGTVAGKPRSAGKHVCEHCGRDCLKPSVLEKHLRCHTGERPYPCTTCGIAFKTQSNLYKHRRTQAHARLSSESEKGGSSSQEGSQGSTETCPESHSLGSLEGPQSEESGSFEKESATCPAELIAHSSAKDPAEQGKATTDTGWALHQAALVGLILAPVNGNQEKLCSITQKRELSSGAEHGTITNLQKSEEVERTSPHAPNRHLPLQRQEATYFSKKWDSRACSGKSQSHDSTDSGYLSHSDSGEQQSWVSSPSNSLREHSMESLPETTMEHQAERATLPIMNCTAETVMTSSVPNQRTLVLEKKKLEERISKLISDNDALVDDKCLENVRPRKTVLSKQGSIDLPMPYTYKDSFHFDMKASKKANTSASWHNTDNKPKQAVYNSVPTQHSTSFDHTPVTRSSSLPFSESCLGWERTTSQSLYHRETTFSSRRDSHLYTGESAARSVDLQSSNHRSLVRQVAVDCLSGAEGPCHSASVEERCQSTLSSEGDSIDITNEQSSGKCRRKKAQKFSYNKWYMYGDGTFRKLYEMEKGSDRNTKIAGGICRTRKNAPNMERRKGPEEPRGITVSPATPVLRAQSISTPDLKMATNADITHNMYRPSCLAASLPARGIVSCTKESSTQGSSSVSQKPVRKGVSDSSHQFVIRQNTILGSDSSNSSGTWSTKEFSSLKEAENTSSMCLGHLPSESKKQKTDESSCKLGCPTADCEEPVDKTQSTLSQKNLISKKEKRNNTVPDQAQPPLSRICNAQTDTVRQENRMNFNLRFINMQFCQSPIQYKKPDLSESQDKVPGTSVSVGKGIPVYSSSKPSFLPKYQLKLPHSAGHGTSSCSPQVAEQALNAENTTTRIGPKSNLLRKDTSSHSHLSDSEEQSSLNDMLSDACGKEHCIFEVAIQDNNPSKAAESMKTMKENIFDTGTPVEIAHSSDACVTATGSNPVSSDWAQVIPGQVSPEPDTISPVQCVSQENIIQKQLVQINSNNIEFSVDLMEESNIMKIMKNDQDLSSTETLWQQSKDCFNSSHYQSHSSRRGQFEEQKDESSSGGVNTHLKSISLIRQTLPIKAETDSVKEFQRSPSPVHSNFLSPPQGNDHDEIVLVKKSSQSKYIRPSMQWELNLPDDISGKKEQGLMQSEKFPPIKEIENISSSTENSKASSSQRTFMLNKSLQLSNDTKTGENMEKPSLVGLQNSLPIQSLSSSHCEEDQGVRRITSESKRVSHFLPQKPAPTTMTDNLTSKDSKMVGYQQETTKTHHLPFLKSERQTSEVSDVRDSNKNLPCTGRADTHTLSFSTEVVIRQKHVQDLSDVSLILKNNLNTKAGLHHYYSPRYCRSFQEAKQTSFERVRQNFPTQEDPPLQHISHPAEESQIRKVTSTSNDVCHQSDLRKPELPTAEFQKCRREIPASSSTAVQISNSSEDKMSNVSQSLTSEELSQFQVKALEQYASLSMSNQDTGKISSTQKVSQNKPLSLKYASLFTATSEVASKVTILSEKTDLSSQKSFKISPKENTVQKHFGQQISVAGLLRDTSNLNNKAQDFCDKLNTVHKLLQGSFTDPRGIQTELISEKLPGQEKLTVIPPSHSQPLQINAGNVVLDVLSQHKLLNKRLPANLGRLETNHESHLGKVADQNEACKGFHQILYTVSTAQQSQINERDAIAVPQYKQLAPFASTHSCTGGMEREMPAQILPASSGNITFTNSQSDSHGKMASKYSDSDTAAIQHSGETSCHSVQLSCMSDQKNDTEGACEKHEENPASIQCHQQELSSCAVSEGVCAERILKIATKQEETAPDANPNLPHCSVEGRSEDEGWPCDSVQDVHQHVTSGEKQKTSTFQALRNRDSSGPTAHSECSSSSFSDLQALKGQNTKDKDVLKKIKENAKTSKKISDLLTLHTIQPPAQTTQYKERVQVSLSQEARSCPTSGQEVGGSSFLDSYSQPPSTCVQKTCTLSLSTIFSSSEGFTQGVRDGIKRIPPLLVQERSLVPLEKTYDGTFSAGRQTNWNMASRKHPSVNEGEGISSKNSLCFFQSIQASAAEVKDVRQINSNEDPLHSKLSLKAAGHSCLVGDVGHLHSNSNIARCSLCEDNLSVRSEDLHETETPTRVVQVTLEETDTSSSDDEGKLVIEL
ncbi:zinc finger protein 831 [Lepisosteus oculatus]